MSEVLGSTFRWSWTCWSILTLPILHADPSQTEAYTLAKCVFHRDQRFLADIGHIEEIEVPTSKVNVRGNRADS